MINDKYNSQSKLVNLEDRLNKLAAEKSNLQLIIQLMNRISSVPGLENTVENILHAIGDVIGGVNLVLIYHIDQILNYVDIAGIKKQIETLDDDRVKQVFDTHEPLEFEHTFSDTRMLTPEFSKAYTWIVPLIVGTDLIGVLKIESLHLSMQELAQQLPTFFNYVALVLKHEIHGHTQLKKAYDDLEKEMEIRKALDEKLKLSNTALEKTVADRTEHLKLANAELRRNEEQIQSLLDKSEQSRRALLSLLEDQKLIEDELLRVNRTLHMLSASNQALIHFSDEQSLLTEVCRIVVEVGDYLYARVDYIEHDDIDTMHIVAQSEFNNENSISNRVNFADLDPNQGPVQISIASGNPFVEHNFESQLFTEPWQKTLSKQGCKSMVVMPLIGENETIGTLSVYSSVPNAFNLKEVNTLKELAGDLTFGITALRVRAKKDLAEQAIRESEDRYRLIADNTADTISVFDMNLKPVFVSPSIQKLRGITVQEALSESLDRILTPASLQKVQSVYSDQMVLEQSGNVDPSRTVLLELEEYCKDGSTKWVELAASFVRDSQLHPSGIITITRDITRRKQAEQKLIESEHKYRSLAESSPDIIVRYNTLCQEVYNNRNLSSILSFEGFLPPENLSEQHPLSDDLDQYFIKLKKVIDSGLSDELELNTRNSSCESQTFNIRFVPEYNNDDIIIGAMAIGRDITERKHAEEALRESEEKYRTIFNNSPLGIFRSTIEGRFLEVNTSLAQMLGFVSPDTVIHEIQDIGKQVYVHTEDRRQVIAQLLNSTNNIQFQTQFRKNDGTEFTVNLYVKLVFDAVGHPAFLEGIVENITERIHAEESLRKLSHAVEQSPASIVITDTIGNIEYVNPKFTEITEYLQSEVIGKNVRLLKSGEQSPETYKRLWDTITSGMEWRGEFHNKKKNGELYWEFASISPIFDGSGTITHFVAVKEDITEHKRLEEQLRQAQKMEAIGQLAGGIAHDFNNMLGVILGHSEIALSQIDQPNRVIANLDEIQKAAERSANLTHQLLAFARKQTVNPKVLNLDETVEGMLKMLRRLIGEDIDLTWLPGAAEWQVNIDPSQIDQILANLCVNARDAINDIGKISIETHTILVDHFYCSEHPEAVSGEFVLLTVSDNGCGMNKEVLKKLFEPFYTTKDIGKGTGLGLATVYGIVKQNNGFINVYSEPGLGTTFKIYLPRYVSKSSKIENDSLVPPPNGNETILLVEDEPTILNLTKLMLEQLGYRVLIASKPLDAIQLSEEFEEDIHLLITDVVMPNLNGRDLAKKLIAHRDNLKYLFMSGYTADVIAYHGVLDKGVNFIQKPFSIQTLAIKVRDTLDTFKKPIGSA